MSRHSQARGLSGFPERGTRASGRSRRPWSLRSAERLEPRAVLAASFALDTSISFPASTDIERIETVDFGDYAPTVTDPSPDVVVTGTRVVVSNGSQIQVPVARVFRNDGPAGFVEVDVGLIGLSGGTAKWGDFNGDNRLDILVTGTDPQSGGQVAKVYRHSGGDTFTPVAFDPLDGMPDGNASWGDFNADGRMDVIVTQVDVQSRFVAVPFLGQTNGTFSKQSPVVLGGVAAGKVAWADFDKDGRIDMAVSADAAQAGDSATAMPLQVYRNDGSGTFRRVWFSSAAGTLAWADFDMDNRLDLLVSTPPDSAPGMQATPYLFKNRADGTFSQVDLRAATLLEPVAAWALADMSGDGRPDAIATGVFGNFWVLRNVTAQAVPDGVFATPGDGQATLYWNAPSNGGAVVTDYRVEYSEDAGFTWNTVTRSPSTATTALIPNLFNDQEYLFRVAAVRGSTVEPFCSPVAVTPFTLSEAADFTYESANGAVTITGYRGFGGNVSVPASLGGLPVKAIGPNAFVPSLTNSFFLTSIIVPEGVEVIGERAFFGHWGLNSVTLPNSLRSISRWAFAGDESTGMPGLALPASLVSLHPEAFADAASLGSVWVDPANPNFRAIDGVVYDKETKTVLLCPRAQVGRIVLPTSVTVVGPQAFAGCVHVTSVVLPEGLTTIGAAAFDGAGLVRMDIPASVTVIGPRAFYYTKSLTEFAVAATNSAYASVGGVLYDKSLRTLIAAPAFAIAGAFTVPGSVTRIADGALAACVGLTEVSLPNGLMAIGDDVFDGTFLSTLALPPTVTSIGKNLTPDGLSEIQFPASVVSVAAGFLGYAWNLTQVTFLGNAPTFGGNAFEEVLESPPVLRYRTGTTGWAPTVAGLQTESISLPLPSAPSAPTGAPGSLQVGLSWTGPANNGESAINNYIVQYRATTSPASEWTTLSRPESAATVATVTGLTGGVSYVFRVAAVNENGAGTFSAASAAVTPAASITFTPAAGVTIGGVEFGTTQLGYAFRDAGQVRQVTFNGQNTSASFPGAGWTMRGVWKSGAGYQGFWRGANNAFGLWTLNASGASTAQAALTAAQVNQLETTLAFDLDQNNRIG